MKGLLFSLLFSLLVPVFLFADDFDDAKKAHNQGNYSKAAELFKTSCDNGNAKGCVMMGSYYHLGLGVERDYSKAVELYKKACDGGFYLACNNLGAMYSTGKGVKQDHSKAAELYKKSCENGVAEGC
ncbi:MAG TPA: sel1 repeat family protein, partial [Candidatus Cloacimonas sp.]|nr:sel1 repeat family protein [Candidatus Cloacimonas sp.]